MIRPHENLRNRAIVHGESVRRAGRVNADRSEMDRLLLDAVGSKRYFYGNCSKINAKAV